ncbi:hypothetical protein AB0F71_13650 [Kitasatospora sp. NPDC028055]|uniref:hypothetical protein n=1 Tax=Kitasatospora sp. NPDC028055 TaxID=3155653 RepID=UPI0033F6DB84
MTGTVVVHAESPVFGLTRHTFGVVVDGVRVGTVRQGDTARFPVPAGTHAVRLATGDLTRSNTVSVQVGEDREFLVAGRGTGLGFAVLVPALAPFAMVPWTYVVAVMALTAAVLWAVPGLLFRVRAVGDSFLPSGPGDEHTGPAGSDGSAGSAEEEGAGAGLWWESDPALAKRFRKSAGS